jgi:hypothetical protein
MQQISDVLLSPQVLILAAGLFAVTWGLGQVKALAKMRTYWRLLPLVPLVLGPVAALLCPLGFDGRDVATKVLLGLWAGFLASNGRSVFKRLFVDKFENRQVDGNSGEQQ